MGRSLTPVVTLIVYPSTNCLSSYYLYDLIDRSLLKVFALAVPISRKTYRVD